MSHFGNIVKTREKTLEIVFTFKFHFDENFFSPKCDIFCDFQPRGNITFLIRRGFLVSLLSSRLRVSRSRSDRRSEPRSRGSFLSSLLRLRSIARSRSLPRSSRLPRSKRASSRRNSDSAGGCETRKSRSLRL